VTASAVAREERDAARVALEDLATLLEKESEKESVENKRLTFVV